MSYSSLFLLLNQCLTKYLLWVEKRKKEDNGRIPTATDVKIRFRPCLRNIFHGQGLGSGRPGQIGGLKGGRTEIPGRSRVDDKGQRTKHRCIAQGKSP